jgi:hypothetical protein
MPSWSQIARATVFANFAVARHSATTTVGRISVNRVIGTLAIQFAPMVDQVADEVTALHATGTSTVRLSQMALPGASFFALAL